MDEDRFRLIKWVVLRTADKTLHWDCHKAASGTEFSCDSISKFVLVSNPSWFIVKTRDDDLTVLWLEGKLCRYIYTEIWDNKPAFRPNIPAIELACIMAPLIDAREKQVLAPYRKAADGERLSDEDKSTIIEQLVLEATESYFPKSVHVDQLPALEQEISDYVRDSDLDTILGRYSMKTGKVE